MRPGKRLILFCAVIAIFALLAPLAPAFGWVLAAGALALAVLALAEYVYLRRIQLKAERPPVALVPLDEPDAIELRLRAITTRPLEVEVRQVLPVLADAGSQTRSGTLEPGQELALSFPVRGVERGALPLPSPVAAMTVFGLCERIVELPAPAELRVQPNLRAVQRLHEQLNNFILRGMGNRTAPRLGKGREFDRLREYNVNDDPRDVAWKASARHGKLIVREYRLDHSQDILVCLDRGHRMASRTTTITKIDHAVNAAVLLGYICNRMEDRIGALSFGAEVDKGIGQGRGASHLRQLTAFATGLRGDYIHTDYLALAAHVRHRLKHRSLILILTDLPEAGERVALLKAVKMLIPQHLPLLMVLTDPELEVVARTLPADKAELSRSLVARDLYTERQRTLRDLRRLGALVVETRPQDTGVAAINAYLDVKRRQLL